jgi:hypothetical protein
VRSVEEINILVVVGWDDFTSIVVVDCTSNMCLTEGVFTPRNQLMRTIFFQRYIITLSFSFWRLITAPSLRSRAAPQFSRIVNPYKLILPSYTKLVWGKRILIDAVEGNFFPTLSNIKYSENIKFWYFTLYFLKQEKAAHISFIAEVIC